MNRAITVLGPDVVPVGGQERFLWELVNGSLERGYRVTVIARRCEVPAHPNLRWVRVRVPRRPSGLTFPAFVLLASLQAARQREGLLVTAGALALNRIDVSAVVHVHHAARARGIASRSRDTLLYRLNSAVSLQAKLLTERWCHRPSRTAIVVADSPGLREELLEHFPAIADRIELIPLGVDHHTASRPRQSRDELRAELGLRDDELMALFVGGDWERKGLGRALHGIAASDGWKLVVAGKGARDRFSQLAAAAGAQDRAIYAGQPDDIAAYYAAADAFLLPTAYESFSLVAHEAAAAGLPLLVGRVSGVEDMLRPGETGWFVDGHAEDIARRLAALRDPAVRARMGGAARTSVRGLRWSDSLDAWDSLFTRMLSMHPIEATT